MALLVEKTTSGREYKVKDLSQADFGRLEIREYKVKDVSQANFGRLEIELAEVEMPGLISCRAEFGPSQPFKGAKITFQTAVPVETLTESGAAVRWCSCNIFSTQDHAAAAIARDSAAVIAWKRETLQEHWRWKGDETSREESRSLQHLAPSPSRDEAREQESHTKPRCHTVFKNLNISLLAIVGIKYQAISQDPFKTLALYTWSFVIAIVIYSLMLFPVKQLQNRCNVYLKIVLGRVLLASGVVSSLSLMSLLLPHMYGLVVIYISWALFVVISALPLLQRAYNGLRPGITTVINCLICFTRNLFTGSNLSQQQQPPQETRPPV